MVLVVFERDTPVGDRFGVGQRHRVAPVWTRSTRSPRCKSWSASAAMSSVAWDPVNASSSQWFVMNYSETVNVTSAATPTDTLGSAGIGAQLCPHRTPASTTLADRSPSSSRSKGWPWQNSQYLVLVVPSWSAFSTSEHMVVVTPVTPRVESVRTLNGQPLRYFEAGTSATTGAPALALPELLPLRYLTSSKTKSSRTCSFSADSAADEPAQLGVAHLAHPQPLRQLLRGLGQPDRRFHHSTSRCTAERSRRSPRKAFTFPEKKFKDA